MPSVYEDVLNRARNGLARPGADRTYGDGDDKSWMDLDWPSLSRDIEVDGRRVHVIDSGGDGPPLLWLHGLGGVWQNWLLNIAAFKDTHRCVAFDLPGFGQSEMPREDISIPGFAQAADAVCRELRLDNPVVLGNSMGGFVGAELALRFPTRVSKLVLVSAAGLSTEYVKREPVLATELARGAGSPGFNDAFRALLTYSFRDKLEKIEVPVLIVWGRNDMLVPVEDAETFEHLIGENAHGVIFDDTGHLAMMERPSRFNELLRGFLAGERAPEAGVEGVSA